MLPFFQREEKRISLLARVVVDYYHNDPMTPLLPPAAAKLLVDLETKGIVTRRMY